MDTSPPHVGLLKLALQGTARVAVATRVVDNDATHVEAQDLYTMRLAFFVGEDTGSETPLLAAEGVLVLPVGRRSSSAAAAAAGPPGRESEVQQCWTFGTTCFGGLDPGTRLSAVRPRS